MTKTASGAIVASIAGRSRELNASMCARTISPADSTVTGTDSATAGTDAGRTLDDRNPLDHHLTNIVVVEITGDCARTRNKGLAVMTNGAFGSVVYEDELRRTERGWRIAVRRVFPRRAPLQPSELDPAAW